MSLPCISIITPSFNQAHYLEETIQSVLNQKYLNCEYIIIDGGSQDNTVEILNRYEGQLAYWVSEPDLGQVDALNKGLAKSTGDLFAFINSDDVYLPGAFAAVVDYFDSHPDCMWLCGDTIMFGEGHKTKLYQAIVPKSAAHALAWEAHCPQPGMFWRRELLKDGFDERWNYCFDHDLYIRLLIRGVKCEHLPIPLAAYRLHSNSKTVAESSRFDDEFDRIAEKYEAELAARDRRWSASTRFLRQSIAASSEGDLLKASKWLGKAFFQCPEALFRRPLWGTLRHLINKAFDD